MFALDELIKEAGIISAALASIAIVVVAVVRHFVLKPLDKRIKEVTQQIQPGANGGESLSDVNRKVDNLSDHIESLIERMDKIETRQMHILEFLLSLHGMEKK